MSITSVGCSWFVAWIGAIGAFGGSDGVSASLLGALMASPLHSSPVALLGNVHSSSVVLVAWGLLVCLLGVVFLGFLLVLALGDCWCWLVILRCQSTLAVLLDSDLGFAWVLERSCPIALLRVLADASFLVSRMLLLMWPESFCYCWLLWLSLSVGIGCLDYWMSVWYVR